MAYSNRKFTWDFDALKRFYERYVVKWWNSDVSLTNEQKAQARENLGISADNTGYDNSESMLESDNVNDAINELSDVINGSVYQVSLSRGVAGYYDQNGSVVSDTDTVYYNKVNLNAGYVYVDFPEANNNTDSYVLLYDANNNIKEKHVLNESNRHIQFTTRAADHWQIAVSCSNNGTPTIKVRQTGKLQIGEVFDISVAKSGAIYADLATALGTNAANVPSTIRKGGMSVRFINTDGKYEQWRYMLSSIANADFANVANWQGVDANPIRNSRNIVESGGVFLLAEQVQDVDDELYKKLTPGNVITVSNFNGSKYINGKTGKQGNLSAYATTEFIPVEPDTYYEPSFCSLTGTIGFAWYESDDEDTFIVGGTRGAKLFGRSPSNAHYVRWTVGAYDTSAELLQYNEESVNKISEVEDDINGINKSIIVETPTYDEVGVSVSLITGKYIAKDGTEKTYGSYAATEFVPVEPDTYYKASTTKLGSTMYLAWYDFAKRLISSSNSAPNNELGKSPSNAAYVRWTTKNATNVKLYAATSVQQEERLDLLESSIGELEGSLSNVEEEVEVLEGKLVEEVPIYDTVGVDATITSGKYIDPSNGQMKTHNRYGCTDFMAVQPDTYYKTNSISISTSHGAAWYDSNQNFIRGLSSAPNKEFGKAPSNAAYIRWTTAAGATDVKLYASTSILIEDRIEVLNEELNNIDLAAKSQKSVISNYLITANNAISLHYVPRELQVAKIAFCLDDGNANLTDITDYFISKGIPFCLALPPSKLNDVCNNGKRVVDAALDVQAAGGEILSHNTGVLKSTSTDEDYYNYFTRNKILLIDAGFDVKGIVKAGGTGSDTALPEKIEQFAFSNYLYGTGFSMLNGRESSIKFDTGRGLVGNSTLDQIKAVIQSKINNRTSAIFYGHGSDWYNSEIDTQFNDYIEKAHAIADYCKELIDGGAAVEFTTIGDIIQSKTQTYIQSILT